MGMTASLRMGLAVLACGILSACAGSTGPTKYPAAVQAGDDDCVSNYDHIASAPTWDALKDAMLGYKERGHVASVRTQVRGNDVGAGDREAVRVVDLLNRNGRRLVQVDVWRTEAGAWRAGLWNQCID